MKREIELFDKTMIDMFSRNMDFLLKRPAYMKTIAKITSKIKTNTKIRRDLEMRETITIPPIMIMSVTNECNLNCAGCYACEQNRDTSEELSLSEIKRIIAEGVALGVSVFLIAGGEPLMKEGLIELPQKHQSTLFAMFTNGTLIDESTMETIRSTRNLIPIISLEGDKKKTDARRGVGIYDTVCEVMRKLDEENRLFGTSITLTNKNFDEIVKSNYLQKLEDMGCRAAFLIEYVPSDGNFDLCLTEEQKIELRKMEEELLNRYHMMIVPLPGDEDRFGGCMAAG